MDTAEVMVVGAGPTGLTLACSLLLHGISVRVVDRAPGPAVFVEMQRRLASSRGLFNKTVS